MKTIKAIWILVIVSALMSGCVSQVSRDRIGLTGYENEQIVLDLSSQLGRQYRAGGTKTVVVSTPIDGGLGMRLAEKLKQLGVKTIALKSFKNADVGKFIGGEIIGITYEIQYLDGHVLVIIKSTDGYSISRLYRRSAGNVTPAGPITVMGGSA